MDNLFIFMISVGVLLLAVSIKPALKICTKTNRFAWGLLLVFIVCFIFGYWWVLYYFVNNDVNEPIALSVSVILLGGGAFVYLVIRLSLKSILEIERSAEHQRFLAEHDSLTNLPNRKKFFKVVNKKIECNEPFILLLIDLSNFKRVNDAYGNSFGDSLLCLFSKVLSQYLSEFAKLYRIGGDEFAVVLNAVSQHAYINCIRLINDAIANPFSIHEQSIRVYLKIGVSDYPKDSMQTNELFKQADLALHEAKKTQQQVVNYFSDLSARADDLFNMSTKIKRALKNQEFELFLQPIFASKHDDMHGAEVLIRWPQNDGTFISPDIFIKTAEQTGQILAISKWVVLETIQHLKKLKKAGFKGSLHVNLSTRDLESLDFYEFIEPLINLDPTLSDFIMFEITEGAMMTNLDTARSMMYKLNAHGFEFSIDDFGTGFSSLSLLRELPISQIKIDQSFIKGMLSQSADHAIVESTLFLANRLNCKVVAEGIENEYLQEALTSMNCDYLQGYYYSKPIGIDDFIKKYFYEEV
ncbi:bifunctional diguanylate cyclase/phosphodiesterase [Pseudoalteromonas sp. SG45-5]|uniref:putative bifunctional diguanylate cyclase/phosphodiesterase n=1 Tax=unclassified Pseudoalteromonas TaxID=194690 RepID=UPI0015F98039|nr:MULTISPECIES: bifunctional diguanylate cyclase/phosphodiesterase [unclassified Pseudoalteromonas]MBB1384803.1 bifunctional diguanylate cyclase/phosphodiesterase [Pseudoalteromonas sp. SG45-5]MBB1392801.1 bifunctional diguanylate cyclase/phosphodiesterase [Pseudoalteromonas sp. SG44-4]MBB1448515.1 bifunctional diguanylate cyclase/phosphodiesterase [Pseudoalteromonas sp. SG41-6]